MKYTDIDYEVSYTVTDREDGRHVTITQLDITVSTQEEDEE